MACCVLGSGAIFMGTWGGIWGGGGCGPYLGVRHKIEVE